MNTKEMTRTTNERMNERKKERNKARKKSKEGRKERKKERQKTRKEGRKEGRREGRKIDKCHIRDFYKALEHLTFDWDLGLPCFQCPVAFGISLEIHFIWGIVVSCPGFTASAPATVQGGHHS